MRTHFLIPTTLFLAVFPAGVSAQEGITRDRLKLEARLTLDERYIDNIYLDSKDPISDFVTAISPKVGVAYGLSKEASLKLDYLGEFKAYAHSDNFGKDSHRVGLDGTWLAPGESKFSIGARSTFSSIQPWSEQDTFKPYTDTEARADILLKTGSFTDLGFAYNRKAVSYKDELYAGDEYTQQEVSANIRYKRYDPNVLFVGYTYLVVDVNDPPGVETGWQSHEFEVGLRWDPTSRLSGQLQGGYSVTRFEASEQLGYFIVDTDLTYRVSEVLTLKIAGARNQGVSSIAAEEIGDYYVSTTGRFYADYRAWENLAVNMFFTYEKRTFYQEGALASELTTDKPIGAGLSVRYTPRPWFSITAGYRHTQTTSTAPTNEYVTDIVDLKLSFAL